MSDAWKGRMRHRGVIRMGLGMGVASEAMRGLGVVDEAILNGRVVSWMGWVAYFG